MPKIALVITVKNEERLIRANVQYHHYLGVSKFFIFLDNTTDNTAEKLKDLDYVEVSPSLKPEHFSNVDNLDAFIENYDRIHTARQCLNSVGAQLKCREEGIDWLINIDADELVCVDYNIARPGHLLEFFNEIDDAADAVLFPVAEVTQRQLRYHNVFEEETLFKKTGPFKRKWDTPYRKILDPINNKKHNILFYYGQDSGKSAIRVNRPLTPRTVHKFKRTDGKKMNTRRLGHLLHYNLYDVDDFIKTHTNFSSHPNTFISGNLIEPTKIIWRDLVNCGNFTTSYIEDYYRNNILFPPELIKKLQKKHFGIWPREEAFVTVNSVKQAFHEMRLAQFPGSNQIN